MGKSYGRGVQGYAGACQLGAYVRLARADFLAKLHFIVMRQDLQLQSMGHIFQLSVSMSILSPHSAHSETGNSRTETFARNHREAT